jgi:transitional endoplasmic reticulum ATPase
VTVSFATFDRLKAKGVAAYKTGDYLTARAYLTDAAECMLELAEQAERPEVRRQREELATELIDLAKDCQRHHAAPPGRGRSRQPVREEEGGAEASDWVVREKPSVGFEDIAGLEDVKQEIRLKMIYPLSHPELASQFGISTGGGVLLYGAPGTGKTMIARAIAREIDATFFRVSAAQVMSKWVGEAEQNVRKLFDAARAEPRSIIFLDECEALVPKRRSDSSTVMQRVVPQILQELEGFDRKAERALLFVGATNKPWMLDEAMLRPGRLDARIYVPLPDALARYRLLEIYLAPRPLADDVDLGELCDKLEGYSGADIKNIAEEAAQRPFLEAVSGGAVRPINHADLHVVIGENPPSVHASDLVRYEKFAGTGK